MSDKTVNDPEGVRAASVGAGAGAAGVAASTTSTTAAGGVGESEQTQTRSFVALPPPPASPTTTIGFLDDPFRSSSQVKVHLDDEKNGGLTSGSSSTRPGTPAGPESLLLPPPAHQHQR
ncbi:hypothetical protein BGZ95_002415 [Linnemannia exigua]|uniref:Uncharacterized protein n=1 Tax=Linnemannia exigua TaxID=604196 RepID=A0AAD4H9J1_9FUNG|nr:hypothetical protein BGZ95_002415 [Linnemannia exigua]